MSEVRHGFRQSHSSGLDTFTRVTHRKKQAKKTVGITLSPYLIDEAKKRNLNISKIAEQALASILEYIPKESETESSKFLTEGSFLKETSCLGSLARWGIALVRRWSRVQIPPEASLSWVFAQFYI